LARARFDTLEFELGVNFFDDIHPEMRVNWGWSAEELATFNSVLRE